MLITLILVTYGVLNSILTHPAIRAHHMLDDKIHRTIQPPLNALTESDKILLPPVCTNGADVPLLDEGLDTSFLQISTMCLSTALCVAKRVSPASHRLQSA